MDFSVESKWQKKWQDSRIFEPAIDDSRKKFFITVPWPYTNNSLHVGHGRTYTTADIIARYKRLNGYNVLFPMAFHQSGTPILAFSDRIRRGDEKTIELYRSSLSEYEDPGNIDARIEEFKEPEKIASYFSERVVKDFTSLGYSIDWRRRFTSADPFYQDIVKWQFRKLDSLGLIKNGKYPVIYSINDRNAVGEDDIADGDIDKVTVEEFTGVIFHGKDFSLIAASLRPETIFGITNLWIAPSGSYVMFSMEGNSYVATEEALEKLREQHQGIEFVRSVSHDEILGGRYLTPFDRREIPVYESGFVDPDNGTGIVYSVPGHAVWDYMALRQAGIKAEPIKVLETRGEDRSTVESLISELGIKSLDDAGKLKEATQRLYKIEYYDGVLLGNNREFSGLSVLEARDAIKQELFKSGEGFIVYETSRKAQTRSGSKVIVAVLGNQWFIDYSVEWWKKASHDVVNSMLFYPEFYRNAMNDAVDWLRERPCARRRGIGTQLPFDEEWVIESLSDSTIYPVAYTNASYLMRIHDELGSVPADILDYVYGGDSPGALEKYAESVREAAHAARKEKDYWYGVDIRLTAPPHISNHLAFYIMNHVAVLPGKDAPRGIIISGIVLSNGVKISKSKGNAISLLKVSTKYSADLYRLFVAVSADIASMLDWNEAEIAAVRKKYDTFVETITMEDARSEASNPQVHEWFLSRFNRHLKEYFEKMDAFDIRGAYISVFYEVLNDLKYVESRGGNVFSCISAVRDQWIKVMSPVIPHTCEELWERIGHGGFVSTEVMDASEIGSVDESVINSERYLQGIAEDVRQIIKATGISPGSIEIETCNRKVRQAAKLMLENRLKEVEPELKGLIPEFMKNRKNIDASFEGEFEVIGENRKYLEQVFGCKVSLRESGVYPGKKNAWPGRPLIRLQ